MKSKNEKPTETIKKVNKRLTMTMGKLGNGENPGRILTDAFKNLEILKKSINKTSKVKVDVEFFTEIVEFDKLMNAVFAFASAIEERGAAKIIDFTSEQIMEKQKTILEIVLNKCELPH